MIIDILAHHVSKSVADMLETKPYYGETATFRANGKELPYPIRNADPEVRLGLMEKYGIDMQALIQTGSVLIGFDAEESAEICRRTNTDNYALVKSYPKKFVNICFISLLDMKSAMDELKRAIHELDCRGITICTNQQGKGLDSSEYFPFYEKLVEHDHASGNGDRGYGNERRTCDRRGSCRRSLFPIGSIRWLQLLNTRFHSDRHHDRLTPGHRRVATTF